LMTQVKNGMTLTEFPVGRHVPAGLPHEPDGRDVGALPTARFKKPQAPEPLPRGR
jgi:hypothetical protein